MARITPNVSLSICLTIACVCGVLVMPASAQTAAGAITGLVKDQAGAAVPGATIAATETRTNFRRVVVSTGDGLYSAVSLPPGEYRLDLELSGFKAVRRTGIRLTTGEKARIDFDLEVGSLQEQVTVVADAPIMRAETASLGTVVENEQVVQLPLNGRLFIMLATIAPGVALPPAVQGERAARQRPRAQIVGALVAAVAQVGHALHVGPARQKVELEADAHAITARQEPGVGGGQGAERGARIGGGAGRSVPERQREQRKYAERHGPRPFRARARRIAHGPDYHLSSAVGP